MRIGYVVNAGELSGVGQRAMQILRRLEGREGVELTKWYLDGVAGVLRRDSEVAERITPWPGLFGSKSINWVRLGRKIALDGGNVWDLSNQTMSFLAVRLQPSVVTVHDIIEVTDPQDARARWLNRYLYSGIGRAQAVIAVSEYTKRQVIEHCGVPEEKVTVVYNGVDRDVFRPLGAFERERDTILYVGSEHPRKNMRAALEVLAAVRREMPGVKLIKVGKPGLAAGRREGEQAIVRLGLEEAVVWREDVKAEELNQLYNEAGVLLFPSRNEGFGLPPLEAMAAGCPVVVSNATSLPEVVGEAGLVHDPDDVVGMAASVLQLLRDEFFAGEQRDQGFAQAKKFSWDTAAEQVFEVYKKLV